MMGNNAIAAWVGRALPRSLRELADRRPSIAMAARTILLVFLFVLLEGFLRHTCHLGAENYAQPVLTVEWLQGLGLLLPMLLLGLFALLRFGALSFHWDELQHGIEIRWFVVALAGLIAWPFATLGYNFYFDQAYLVDRVLLLAALLGLWFRPAFILVYLPLAMNLMYQMVEPSLGGSILAHKEQVLRVLTMFAVFALMHASIGNRRSADFVFLAACLVAGAYWEAAIAKIELDWLSFGNLYRALFSAYAHGWQATADPAHIASFGEVLRSLDWPMRLFVLGIEAACLVFLVRRPVSLLLLVCVVVFHLGVFAVFGFLFWTWILLDVALLVLLARHGRALFPEIHQTSRFLLSLVLIGTISFWARPPQLGWLDTGLSYTLRYTAVGESGREYPLSPRFFAPYADVFTMSAFAGLISEQKRLTGSYGVTKDRDLADRIVSLDSADAVLALESEFGRSSYDPVKAQGYRDFFKQYLQHWNTHGAMRGQWEWLSPPAQFWSSVRGAEYSAQEPIRELRVEELTNLYIEGRLATIRVSEVAKVAVPSEAVDQ